MSKIRVVIVDDESPARRKIRRFLANADDFAIIGEAAAGQEAVRLIGEQKPDLVFLDVQMPGLDGFEVIEALPAESLPEIVFTTAYDQFALRAFEVQAFDYLLKPFDQPRFQQVLMRVRARFEQPSPESWQAKVHHLLEELRARPRYGERLLVNHGDRALLLEVEKIKWIEAAKNYVCLHTERESYLMRGTIEGLQQKLDPAKFLRANRSQIVNLASIKELQPWFHGEYRIVLKDGTVISWTRTYLDNPPDWLIKRI